jgi:hypothetical protein
VTERKLKKPVEELRRDLLADERTQGIARTLGMPLEDYVEKVLDYAQHPEKQPEFNVVSDEQVKANGGATVADVKGWLNKVLTGEVALGPKGYTDGFDEAPARKGPPLK